MFDETPFGSIVVSIIGSLLCLVLCASFAPLAGATHKWLTRREISVFLWAVPAAYAIASATVSGNLQFATALLAPAAFLPACIAALAGRRLFFWGLVAGALITLFAAVLPSKELTWPATVTVASLQPVLVFLSLVVSPLFVAFAQSVLRNRRLAAPKQEILCRR